MTIQTKWISNNTAEIDANFTFSDNAYNRLCLAVKDHFKVLSALLNEVAGAGKQIWVATEMQRIALEAQGNADQEQ